MLNAYPGEGFVLLLVALASLAIVNVPNTADVSRLGLTQALVRDGSLRTDRYAAHTVDKAHYGGHTYTDKAPGVSVLAIVPYELLRTADSVRGNGIDTRRR